MVYFTVTSTMSTLTTTTIAHLATGKKDEKEVKQETAVTDQFATGGYPFPGLPIFDDPYKKRQWQLEHMAGAFRVFARKGFTEGTAGHISVRDPVQPDTFWINPYVL